MAPLGFQTVHSIFSLCKAAFTAEHAFIPARWIAACPVGPVMKVKRCI